MVSSLRIQATSATFLVFPAVTQPSIKLFNNWIDAGCYECGHVQRSLHTARPPKMFRRPLIEPETFFTGSTPSRALISRLERRLNSGESGGHGAHALNAMQSLRELFEVVSDMVIHIVIDPHKLVSQRFDDDINAFSAFRVSLVQPVSLSNQHSEQLSIPTQSGPGQIHYYPSLQMRYGVRKTVWGSDEWLSVCAIRCSTGLKLQEVAGIVLSYGLVIFSFKTDTVSFPCTDS